MVGTARRAVRTSRRGVPTSIGKDAADLEQRHVAGFVVQIMTQRVQQAGNQTRPKHVHVAAERIGQFHNLRGVRVGGHEFRGRFRNQRLSLRLVQTEPDQNAPRLGDLVVKGVEGIRADGAARRCRGNFFHAMEPGHFLDQVGLALQIHTKGGDAERDRFRGGGHRVNGPWFAIECFQAELAEMILDVVRFEFGAEQLVDLVMPQGDLCRLDRIGIAFHRAFGQSPSGGFHNQLRAALAGPIGNANVRAALETIGSVGAQIERLRGAPDVRRFEISAFDQYVFGLLMDLGVLSAHDARQGDGPGFIGDEQHLRGQSSLLAVQRDKRFSVLGAADDEGGR